MAKWLAAMEENPFWLRAFHNRRKDLTPPSPSFWALFPRSPQTPSPNADFPLHTLQFERCVFAKAPLHYTNPLFSLPSPLVKFFNNSLISPLVTSLLPLLFLFQSAYYFQSLLLQKEEASLSVSLEIQTSPLSCAWEKWGTPHGARLTYHRVKMHRQMIILTTTTGEIRFSISGFGLCESLNPRGKSASTVRLWDIRT